MKQAELIEKAKNAIQGTEADVARNIQISAQALNQFKKGKPPMPDRIAIRLAKLAGLDPAATVAAIEAEQASDETRETWQEIARRAGIAAILMMAVGISVTYPAGEATASAQCLLCQLAGLLI